MSGDAGALPTLVDEGTQMTPSSRYVALGRVEPELVGFPGKTLTRDGTKRLRFDVHATDLLHSMDAVVVVGPCWYRSLDLDL